MCLAIPGKILKIKEDKVIVAYPGGAGNPEENREAINTGFDLKEGEYVFVQAGIVIQKIPEDEAIESLKTWAEVL